MLWAEAKTNQMPAGAYLSQADLRENIITIDS